MVFRSALACSSHVEAMSCGRDICEQLQTQFGLVCFTSGFNLSLQDKILSSCATILKMAPKKQLKLNFFDMACNSAHMGIGMWK